MYYRSRRRKHADNEFTALTGLRAVKMLGGSQCLLSYKKSCKEIPISKYAWHVYHDPTGLSNNCVKVTSSCGVLNCVLKEHLFASYKPYQKDAQYIKDNLKIDGKEHLAHVLKVPLSVFEAFLAS